MAEQLTRTTKAPEGSNYESELSGIVRSFCLLALLLIASCARPIATAPDKDPIVAALTHFNSLSDLHLMWGTPSGGFLLVNGHYQTGKESVAQLGGDLSDEAWSVPEEARLDMDRRTDAKEPFPTSDLPSFIRILGDDPNAQKADSESSRLRSGAKCSLALWPAGYTPDGRLAVVRFRFGPTPHGASATYLLELREGLWHVAHFKLAYYV